MQNQLVMSFYFQDETNFSGSASHGQKLCNRYRLCVDHVEKGMPPLPLEQNDSAMQPKKTEHY